MRFFRFLSIWLLFTTVVSAAEAPQRPGSATSHAARKRPNLYVLSVGINSYPGKQKLHYAVRDAEEIDQVFQTRTHGLFGHVEVKLLTNQEATRENILEGLEWLRHKATPRDTVVFFFSGHGMKDVPTGFYLVPAGYQEAHVDGTTVSGDELKARLATVPGKVLALVDACDAGAILQQNPQHGVAKIERFVKRGLLQRSGHVAFFCAARGNEVADEASNVRHAYFTKALLEGLSGEADANHDGEIGLEELRSFVARRVSELSKGKQHPVLARTAAFEGAVLTRP